MIVLSAKTDYSTRDLIDCISRRALKKSQDRMYLTFGTAANIRIYFHQ
jgi:hypothetical protein